MSSSAQSQAEAPAFCQDGSVGFINLIFGFTLPHIVVGSPSTSLTEINARQSLVAFFHRRPHFLADLAQVLANVDDTGRIVQRFLLGRGDTSDLLALNTTIAMWSAIRRRIDEERHQETVERDDYSADEWISLNALMSRLKDFNQLADRISIALETVQPSNEAPEPVQDFEESEGSQGIVTKSIWKYSNQKWVIKSRQACPFFLSLPIL